MLAITGQELNRAIGAKALANFRDLADCGCVPAGMPSGHRDGWGMAAYRNGKVSFSIRRATDASKDAGYPKAARKAAAGEPEILMVHFRKASIGKTSAANSAPHVFGNMTLAHNGTIFESERIPLKPASRRKLKGETDSEKVLALLVENMKTAKGFRAAFVQTVKAVKKICDYRAMNFFASDGKTLLVLRDFNPKNPLVIEKNLKDYYTMFAGSKKGIKGKIFSSEKLALPGVTWRLLRNRELVQARPLT